MGGPLTHTSAGPPLSPSSLPSASEAAVPLGWTLSIPLRTGGSVAQVQSQGRILYKNFPVFWNPNRASLLPAEILTGAPFSFLGALAQAARRTGRRGGKTWKGFCGLGFSVMDPNRTLKAKPVTVLKGRGRKRRRRKIPIKEAETTGRSSPPVNVAQPVEGWARLPVFLAMQMLPQKYCEHHESGPGA